MLKRALALVIVLSLALGAAAMAEENAFGWEVPEETLRIYIFYNASNFATGEEQDLGIENMKAYMLENFNVEYEVITTDGDADEQLNLMLASEYVSGYHRGREHGQPPEVRGSGPRRGSDGLHRQLPEPAAPHGRYARPVRG